MKLYNELPMQPLRQIPPVSDVLRELTEFRDILTQPFANDIIERTFADVRRELAESGNGATRPELTTRIAGEIARRLRESQQPSLRRVINGSGVVLHTNLGRAVLPEAAIDHLREVSTRFSNLEFDVKKGARGKRDDHLAEAIQMLLGSEASVVVNNNAAAVLLVLNTLGEGGDVIASRGEQVEIGESFRIPDIMARSGARLREVGSTNRTRIRDYENAINENTRLLLRVHPSNFRMIGFTERPSLDEFVEMGRQRQIPTFEDLGSGCIHDMAAFGIPGEPRAQDSIRAGVDIIAFSGDKLLGGPQAGIIAGKKVYIEKIRRNPLFRALRVDKLTIAVLEYVLRAYLRGEPDAVPTWQMLRAGPAELRARAESFAERLGACVTPVELKSLVGGGSAPEAYLSSWGVALNAGHLSDAELENRLRMSNPPVISRIEGGRVILDFRTILPAEESELLRILKGIAETPG
jgi:L-seryl-tRNA(Ser) seleniumtransferase